MQHKKQTSDAKLVMPNWKTTRRESKVLVAQHCFEYQENCSSTAVEIAGPRFILKDKIDLA